MVESVDLGELWTVQEPLEIKNKDFWMKLRIKNDRKTNQVYYDILGGRKGKEAHVHYGFNLKGDLIFDLPREQVQKLRREADSHLHGRISDEEKILKKSEGKINFIFRVIVKASTRESRVSRFEFRSPTSESPPSDLPM